LGLTGPIRLVLDNARYQHCALVMDLAKSLNIELLFLPSYSPNRAYCQKGAVRNGRG